MPFQPQDRVEHAVSNAKGTVEVDDGEHVRVRWDDGKIGNLKYDRRVAYNAYLLLPLRKS
jgi:hypothetical protein